MFTPSYPPAELPTEVGHGHHLDERDSERGEVPELAGCRLERALEREGADMHLVDDAPFRRNAAPLSVPPRVARGVDDPRRTVRTVRLKARRGIGERLRGVAVESVAIQLPGASTRDVSSEVAFVAVFREGHGRSTLEDHLDRLAIWSPHAEARAAALALGTDGITTCHECDEYVCASAT